MRCDEASALIDAFADDALVGAEEAAVRDHVAACARCAALAEASRRLSAALVALPLDLPSAAADARARAAVAEERAWAAWKARLRRRVLVGGSVASLAAAAVAAFVVTPAMTQILERVPSLSRAGTSWLRFEAAPLLRDALPSLAAALALLVVVLIAERRLRSTATSAGV